MKRFLTAYFTSEALPRFAAGLTLFLLVFHSFEPRVSDLALMIVVPLVFWNKRWLVNPWMWLFLGVLGIYSVFSAYIDTDNHKWLNMYWIWVLVIVLFQKNLKDQKLILHFNARFFLVASMGFSVFWKIKSQDFLSSSFMEYTFLSDDRFESLLSWIGIEEQVYREWYKLTGTFSFENGFQQEFYVPRKVAILSILTTWAVLVGEGLIALFYAIRRGWADICGHITLIGFIIFTYLIAPVIGFGTILTILGLVVLLSWDYKKSSFSSLRKLLLYGYFMCFVALAIYDYLF